MASARELLLSLQNPDGGWGYYPGKQSALEPTSWALLAIDRINTAAISLLSSWQRPDGAFRTAASVDEPGWATSLAVLALAAHERDAETNNRGLNWLLNQEGARESFLSTVARVVFSQQPVEQNPNLRGWPWCNGHSSWVEPTSYAVLALRSAGSAVSGRAKGRIQMAEQMLLDRRCNDGGWNHGNRRVFKTDLTGFAEPTSAALLALYAVRGTTDLAPSLNYVERTWRAGTAPMGTAWLRIVQRLYDLPFQDRLLPDSAHNDITTLALYAIGDPDGAWPKLRFPRGKG